MLQTKVHLFRVVPLDNSQPLEQLLARIHGDHLSARLRHTGLRDIRLECAEPPSHSKPYWLLDFGLIRFDGGPGRASAEVPIQSFALEENEGFAEESAALYDPKHHAMLIQYNHQGPRSGSIEAYLSAYDQDVPSSYDMQIQLRADAQARLAKKKVFTRLFLKVAPARLTADFRRKEVSITSALSATQASFGGDYVSIEVALERSSDSCLPLANLVDGFWRLVGHEHDAVKQLEITGKDDPDRKAEVINLLRAKVEMSFSRMPLDDGLRVPRTDRWEALERAYSGWKDLIEGL
jgi:hypothetical protein